eukprot:CAMPEP_0183810186 /NCGR_PEP_ID=MMETSP0803_2-20130417/46880_1 /TAXON_ID=195967 /ORGANISM="Crustomastix stigmata, Strain CCMP3273" /LENGTH=261 /DNA_ID=CAMNT_0026054999 /DNA_START=74 /DNA_END=859 /DNA_ORIENTATION=+
MVRIMPFYPGDSIELTGVVFGDGQLAVLKHFLGMFGISKQQSGMYSFIDCGATYQCRFSNQVEQLGNTIVEKVGKALHQVGYKGFFNANGAVYDDNIYLTEINARPPIWFTGFWDQWMLLDALIRGNCALSVDISWLASLLVQHDAASTNSYILYKRPSNQNLECLNGFAGNFMERQVLYFSFNGNEWEVCKNGKTVIHAFFQGNQIFFTTAFTSLRCFDPFFMTNYVININNLISSTLGVKGTQYTPISSWSPDGISPAR